MTEGELKPCPFCGGSPSMMLNAAEGWHVRYIKCADCGGQAREFVYRQPELAQEQAIAAWNARTPSATPSDEVMRLRELLEDARDALCFADEFDLSAMVARIDAAISAIEGEKK